MQIVDDIPPSHHGNKANVDAWLSEALPPSLGSVGTLFLSWLEQDFLMQFMNQPVGICLHTGEFYFRETIKHYPTV